MSRSERGTQADLSAFGSADSARCRAIAVYASRRCENDALPGTPYCGDHAHLLDATDLDMTG